MYVCGSGSDDVSDDGHVEVDPNFFFLNARCDFEALKLVSNSTLCKVVIYNCVLLALILCQI